MSRGRCQECGFAFRLRKDGTVQTHRLWVGSHRLAPCRGSGLKPSPAATRRAVIEGRA